MLLATSLTRQEIFEAYATSLELGVERQLGSHGWRDVDDLHDGEPKGRRSLLALLHHGHDARLHFGNRHRVDLPSNQNLSAKDAARHTLREAGYDRGPYAARSLGDALYKLYDSIVGGAAHRLQGNSQ